MTIIHSAGSDFFRLQTRGPAGPPGGPGPSLHFPPFRSGGPAQYGPGRSDLLPPGPALPAGGPGHQGPGQSTEPGQVPGVQRPQGAGLLPDLCWEVWRGLPGLPRSVLDL